MDTSQNLLYQQCIEIAAQFLGPAASRFINRQITQHLQIEPDQLQKEHLPELSQWVKVSATLLTDNQIASDFSGKILNISV